MSVIDRERAHWLLLELWVAIDALLRDFPARVAPLIAAEVDQKKRREILKREAKELEAAITAARDRMRERLLATEH
jgi:hypothetical protein